jgi:protein-S-isoprenylcysteine O-methyltransferase Ste14
MAKLLRILIFASIGWMAFQIMLIGYRTKIKPFGRPPIPWPALLLAKIGAGVSFTWMLWQAASGKVELSWLSTVLFLILLLGGTLIITPALFQLGKNLRVGLPNEGTTLITSGVYRFSRNPIYVAIFCVMGASLVYALSWVNLVAAVVSVYLHHRIVLAEERFLARQFKEYETYRNQVRRYL